MIKIDRISDGIEEEIDRLAKGLTYSDILRFESVLASQYTSTQRRVHVVTGSLKLSGKVESDATDNKWEGSISYGGVSAGINNPVDYAEFERERDGSHDFLDPAVKMSDAYIAAMNAYLGG